MDKQMATWFETHPDYFNWNGVDITDTDLYYLGIQCVAKALHYLHDDGGHSNQDITLLAKLVIPQMPDTDSINPIILKFLNDNSDKVNDYKNGNDKIVGFFVGKLIKIIGPSCDGKLLKEKIIEQLKKMPLELNLEAF